MTILSNIGRLGLGVYFRLLFSASGIEIVYFVGAVLTPKIGDVRLGSIIKQAKVRWRGYDRTYPGRPRVSEFVLYVRYVAWAWTVISPRVKA
jgi:hypothetical protein